MRHAETEFNRKGIIQGSEVDSSINNVGDYQAERFYNFYKNINFDKIYVSGLRRTYQTIIRFVNSGIQCEKLDEFNEISWGVNQGKSDNLDEYENTYTVTAVATTDFVDYANQDYRIRRDSALYKSNNGMNFGAIQNEDFEFVSVS